MSCCSYLITVIFTFGLLHNVCPSCVFQDGKYDLSALDIPGGWKVADPSVNGTKFHYLINVCQPINYSTSSEDTGCVNSSVCQISGNTSISFGNAPNADTNYGFASHSPNGFSLYLLTNTACNNSKGVYRATINFACGPNLGVPELILMTHCQINFLWKTYAACHNKPAKRQVPCYVIDEEGETHDLSHLIKQQGGYFVNTPNPAIDFVINVCSDILPDNATKSCPVNSSACRIIGSETLLFGTPQGGLQSTQEGLVLTYSSSGVYSKNPAGCNLEPKTRIIFKCPRRGHSHPPKVISDSNCQYEVEWETEYACPESILKSDLKSCQFTTENHGVEIDLSPLKALSTMNVSSISSNTTVFRFSVCGGLDTNSCGKVRWNTISGCMVYTNNNTATIMGSTIGSQLIYADDDVILTYQKGSPCGNGMDHSTVMRFICDPNATANGIGEPQHISSENCVHLFEWPTKYACLKRELDTPCDVTFESKRVSLQKLLLTEGEPWEALDRRMSPSKDNVEYYINVCGQLSSLDKLSGCGDGSSACVLRADGTYLNLGNFSSPPLYDNASNSVRLEYSGGSPCGVDKHWKSTIDFICRPGQINSEPILTRVNENECLYEFEWETAEACPQGVIEGTDCKVYDDNLGISYDLSPLKSTVYEADTELYTFLVSICGPVQDSPCSKNHNSSGNVGVCQVNKLDKTSWTTGVSSSNVSYMDGVVNLTYLSGDPYNDKNKTPRMTIIVFICDVKAGNGHPNFVWEIDYAYVFHWYTNLVCPQPASVSTECLAHDPLSHLIYDLSSLSQSKRNWVSVFVEDGKERQIVLNVCRPLAQPSVCDPFAAACIVETTEAGEQVVVSNIGRATSSPVLFDPGYLTLTYTDGNPCVAYGKNTTYSLVIQFLCGDVQTMVKKGPLFLSKLGACEYSILWTTNTACPTNTLQAENTCQLTDPDSGFTFDLSSLHLNSEPYTVKTSTGIYQLNVCGKVNEGCKTKDGKYPSNNVSVCQVDKEGNMISEIAFADSYFLNYFAERELTLTYPKSNSTGQEVVIRFPCNDRPPDAKRPMLEFHHDGRYVFRWKTRLTCIPTSFDCSIVDKNGFEYDLSDLSRFTGNWEIPDFRPDNMHLRYHINFCMPLNKVNSYQCPRGGSSACQTNTSDSGSSGFDLGSMTGPPTVSDRGTVVVRYTNGSPCRDEKFRQSTTINLFCSKESGRGVITFMGETPECEYVFSMETAAACPLHGSQGFDCTVRDPLFGYMFDLNPLKSKNNNYNVTVGNYEYLFNVCEKLSDLSPTLSKCVNSSVCQTKSSDPTFSKSLGLPSESLFYRNGVITLEYKEGSGNCHGKYNRSTKVTFTCHHEHQDKDGPHFVSEAEDCTYLFEWPTVHACPPFEVVECSVVDENGYYYDFSKLSLPNDNYYLKYPYSNKRTFVINVCRSVVNTPNSQCPYTSAVCLMDTNVPQHPVNLGRVSGSPYIEDGSIKINYTSGDPCYDAHADYPLFWGSVIEFTCDANNFNSQPRYLGKDGCTYYFEWFTAYACPSKPVEVMGNCTAEDPITGHVYNLTALKEHGTYQSEVGQHRYYMSICGEDANSSPCGPGAGVCQEEMSGQRRSWKAGKTNADLLVRGEVLFLNYSGGDPCHDGRFQRNSVIEFRCGEGIGEPKFLFESNECTYFFYWKTELACQPAMHCAIQSGNESYDLTSLTRSLHTASSDILNDTAAYYVSVCNSVPGFINGIFCPPGSGICRVTKDAKSMALAQSLGKVAQAPFLDFMGHPTIIYNNGSTCLTNMNETNRARIIFLCDSEIGMGEPVLVDINNSICLYLFEWKTSIVCPPEPEPVDEGVMACNFTDRSRGIHFDLSPLQRVLEPYKVNERDGRYFLLQVCSSLQASNISNCEDSAVCETGKQTPVNHGLASSQRLTFDGRRLRLTYRDGEDCPSGERSKRSSEIFFTCDVAAGFGVPELHKKYSCLTVFTWKTSLVCQNMQQQCSFEVGGNHYDFNLLSSLSHNWNTSDGHKHYWINLCRGIQETPETRGCAPTSAVCMKNRKDSSMITLGTVQSMVVKPINSTDLLLEFQSGDRRACTSIDSNRALTPKTRIFMRCGTTLGHPKKFQGPDSKCFYDFVWESSLACADRAEQVMLEKDGILKDERYGYEIDISDILNITLSVTGRSATDHYVYDINLSGLPTSVRNPCVKAAVCQIKPGSKFRRDIGSFDTRVFVIRGSELHLTFTSGGRPCGKNSAKNVTSLINMQCVSAAGIGKPVFLYESGECDYIFEWETIAVCPGYHRVPHFESEVNIGSESDFQRETDFQSEPNNGSEPDSERKKTNGDNPNPIPHTDELQPSHSSHTAEAVIGVLFAAAILMLIAFVLVKPERRAHVSHRFRAIFGRVSLPQFRYKRSNGERLVLVDASDPHPYDDDRDVEMLN